VAGSPQLGDQNSPGEVAVTDPAVPGMTVATGVAGGVGVAVGVGVAAAVGFAAMAVAMAAAGELAADRKAGRFAPSAVPTEESDAAVEIPPAVKRA
jgi:hypothetical protein